MNALNIPMCRIMPGKPFLFRKLMKTNPDPRRPMNARVPLRKTVRSNPQTARTNRRRNKRPKRGKMRLQMKLEWITDIPLNDAVKEKMQAAADQCIRTEGISVPCAISVRLCDDDEIARINAFNRGINRSTDVLSFPTVSYRLPVNDITDVI